MANILIDFIGDFLSGILDFIFDPWINKTVAKWKQHKKK